MKIKKILFILVAALMNFSCSDYLDIVPEGTPTLDHAFADRERAEQVLATCYRYLPDPTDCWTYPGYASFEFTWSELQPYDTGFDQQEMTLLSKGRQTSASPYLNFWSGGGGRKVSNLFEAIRMCNIFLENINKPYDLTTGERLRWTAEVKFLKAYYHYFLLQLYGPIPLIKENLPVDASPEEVKVFREPFDHCVAYIVELLDEAIANLPMTIGNEIEEAGRVTLPAALAVKAKVQVLAASELFNGNPDYAMITDKQGRNLFPTEKDPNKWVIAAESIKEAIDVAESRGGIKFYETKNTTDMPDSLKLLLKLRGAVTDRWNEEQIWATTQRFDYNDKGNYRSGGYPWWDLARECMPNLYSSDSQIFLSEAGVPLHIAEMFYSDNGLPLEEDPEWIGKDRYALQQATEKEKYYIKEGETTVKFHFGREARFYANLGFDRSIWQMKVTEIPGDPNNPAHPFIQGMKGEISGFMAFRGVNPTGYWAKKLVAYGTSGSYQGTRPSLILDPYSLPYIRLADLYLLYSEALNEAKSTPDSEVYYWIDKVRERAGLKGVVESWQKSANVSKPTTKDGMREIIHRERMIELAFEGQMFFDLRRWKWDAYTVLNKPITGWTFAGETKDIYYKVNTIFTQRNFTMRDFLWPIKDYDLTINNNLVQNPGWK